jgi:hypothetical protein
MQRHTGWRFAKPEPCDKPATAPDQNSKERIATANSFSPAPLLARPA